MDVRQRELCLPRCVWFCFGARRGFLMVCRGTTSASDRSVTDLVLGY